MEPMDFVIAAYTVSGILIMWLILSTWQDARRVANALSDD